MKKFSTPPIIRVFLSSTFADMDKERSYFNEVIAPKISRICSERGVSFFSVDLRWGITKEDQIDGNVLPICLSEIDKCRPYFIGMIGNRYGSVLETVPDKISQSIPWLKGKEGNSITELEMLYAILDHDRDDCASNSAFYIRSDKLSKELYGDLIAEDNVAISRLNELKKRVTEDKNIPSSDYNSIEEFGESVMKDLINWLDINFPKSEDVSNIRKNWYNSEILRNHVDNLEMTDFINTYLKESHKPLLIYGDGARGKTACLTAWQPIDSHKILINCAADDSFTYWPSVAKEIVNSINKVEDCGYPKMSANASMVFQFTSSANKESKERLNSDFYFVSDSEREDFRLAFINWLNNLTVKNDITIVINDLNLLDDEQSKYLSWLPISLPNNINIICTTNDDEMIQTAELLGWNIKEMPLFKEERARSLINEHLHSYGKNLSNSQFDKLMSSIVIKYPGQLRFIVNFLINYGRFDNLDDLIEKIATINKIDDIYKYVYDELSSNYSEKEIKIIHAVLGIVRSANVSLSERECFELSQKISPCTQIEWSHLCRLFEQFDIIKGDYWNIRNEEVQKFIDCEISENEIRTSHLILGDHFFEQLFSSNNNKTVLQKIRDNTAYAKETLFHYQQSKEWDKLIGALSNNQILYYLSKLDWHYIKSAWMALFLYSDKDVCNILLNLVEKYWNNEKDDKLIAIKLGVLLKSMGYKNGIDKLYEIVGSDDVLYSDDGVNLRNMITEEFVPLYNEMFKMKSERNFRGVIDFANNLLIKEKSFNNIEICQVLFFKSDAEIQLNLIDDVIKTANDYYLNNIKKQLLNTLLHR